MITNLNKHILFHQLKRLFSRIDFRPTILWVGTPTAAFTVDLFNQKMTIYHAVDRFSEFPFVDKKKILQFEKSIANKADLVICTSDAIKNDLIEYNVSTYTVTHAVDFYHFYDQFNTKLIPSDIENVPKPILGYFGGLSERVDLQLLNQVARTIPHASIVLLGKELTNIDILKKIPNVYILGSKSFTELPSYLSKFDVCMIPYRTNKLMEGVDPIKLREYLSQGKPVVSVDLPEVRKLNDLVYVAKDAKDYILKLYTALNENDGDTVKRRIDMARKNDWGYKIEDISNLIRMVKKEKMKTTLKNQYMMFERKHKPVCNIC